MNDPLQTTLADAAELLNRNRISYALVGGMAASLLGQPRATADVDLVIRADVADALALANSLENTKFRPLFDNVAEVIERSFILPLKHRSTNVKVDVAIGLSGFEIQAVARARPIDIAGTTIFIITAEDLLIMKVLAGRPQDDLDARAVVTAQGDRLDWRYCLATGAELGQALGQDLVRTLQSLKDSKTLLGE